MSTPALTPNAPSTLGWLALHGGAGWLADTDTAKLVLADAQSLVVVPTAAAFEQPDEAVAASAQRRHFTRQW